ncbi:MAG: uroporphyrinogen decarboxylase family protein [Clostridiales bacterium]|nr:uroporphyrinogen decarboxylase family protein [Clostridiales bacterium]
MNNRERTRAILNYEKADRIPVVHFGFWDECYALFEAQGHIPVMKNEDGTDRHLTEREVFGLLGFDFGWGSVTGANNGLLPCFETKVVKEFPDGGRHILNSNGVTVWQKPGKTSIPAEISHTLVDRESWEKEFLPRLRPGPDRYPKLSPETVRRINSSTDPVGVHCGSLYGTFRDWAGFTGTCYILADDEELFGEILRTLADICYDGVKAILDAGVRPDFGHFWEDICFKNGPLVNPAVFDEYCGPGYARITGLLKEHGCSICSLDCDGCIDSLIPTWLENGVNTMFPIEVGTWNASIGPWRQKYGRALRGVGGMDKRVFAMDYAAVDAEIERLRPLVEMGGFIPCPDHRIPPDAKWDNILYYTDKFRKVFG